MADRKSRSTGLAEHTSAYRSVAIVIPMYNEVESIPLLSYKLKMAIRILSDNMAVHLVLVDDGSTDMTFEEINSHFGDLENTHFLRNYHNMGYGQALRKGVDRALEIGTDLIVTIDADTNYDHFYIPMFITMFPPDCDIMTASPWHPDGQKKYFPKHRLFLSLTLSWLYRKALRKFDQPLYTYSSCFRVAKADVYKKIVWEGRDFVATSEIMCRCIINGLKVSEQPFAVNPRWFGVSKMRKLIQIKKHLMFLYKIWRNPKQYEITGNS